MNDEQKDDIFFAVAEEGKIWPAFAACWFIRRDYAVYAAVSTYLCGCVRIHRGTLREREKQREIS